MSSFFKNMNLARAIVLLALLGSAYLFYVNTQKRDQLEFLNRSLATKVPQTVENIQRLSQQYSKLVRVRTEEGLKDAGEADAYIRRKAAEDGAELGHVDVGRPNESSYASGIQDVTHTVRPVERDSEFTREQLAYFMWQLEAGSNRLKVADIDLNLANRRGLEEHDIPEDRWTFTLQTKTRRKVDQ